MARQPLEPVNSDSGPENEMSDEDFVRSLKPENTNDFRLPLILWTAAGILGCWLGFLLLPIIFGAVMTPVVTALVLGVIALGKTVVLGTVTVLTAKDAPVKQQVTRWIWTLAAAAGSVGCFWAAFRYSVNGWYLLAGCGIMFVVFLAALMKNADEHLPITWLACSLALEAGLVVMLVGP